jgi:hypothetical protein
MDGYKLQLFRLFNKIEFIIYIEYSFIMKVCLTLQFFNVLKDNMSEKWTFLLANKGYFFYKGNNSCCQTKLKINDMYIKSSIEIKVFFF